MRFSGSFEIGRSPGHSNRVKRKALEVPKSSKHDSLDGALGEEAQLQLYLDYWKQTVDVQKHFNDIEWRIRGLALTVVTFAFGAAGLAVSSEISVGPVSFGSIILLIGAALWYAFYFVDSVWYHPMLKASVQQAEEIEKVLKLALPAVGTTTRISTQSPQRSPWIVRLFRGRDYEFRSNSKLNYFYAIGFAVLIVGALAFEGSLLLNLFAERANEASNN